MRIAVLTLTRDRLAYTQHCFQTLRDLAGCEFDWFVLDQGSSDETPQWLIDQGDLELALLPENVGICRGLNMLLDELANPADYDVLVRFDNDCEVLQPDTLAVLADLADSHDLIAAPRVLGLRSPPMMLSTLKLDGFTLTTTTHLGGIFMVIPARLFSDLGYRFDEAQPPFIGDEQICSWWRGQGGRVGYVEDFTVNHYLTTAGQEADPQMRSYWDRKLQEMHR